MRRVFPHKIILILAVQDLALTFSIFWTLFFYRGTHDKLPIQWDHQVTPPAS